MIEASCHCGAVRMEIAEAPATVTDCNCSICRRLGALWAYYDPSQVKLLNRDATDTYVWGKKRIEFHHCRACGCTTHWRAIDKKADEMGVNARLMKFDLGPIAVRHFNGAAR